MIKEAYCSKEVAKLLKEKGFDVEKCTVAYYCDCLVDYTMFGYCGDEELIFTPTHQMAMAWLREEKNILITVIPQEIQIGVDKLCYGIYRITEDLYQPLYNGRVDTLVDSYEEAVEAAIKYCLENLI